VRRTAPAILLALLAWGTASAAEAPPAEPPREAKARPWAPLRYLHERLADLLDIVELNVGAGRGVKLDVKYGVQFLGLSDLRTRRVGILDRRVGAWREIDSEIGLLPFSFLAYPVEQVAGLCGWRRLAGDAAFVRHAGTLGIQYLDRKELHGDPEFFIKDTVEGPLHTRWGDSFPIGAEVHAGVGIRFLLRPLQLVDFVAGFVGIELDPWLNAEQKR